MNDSRCIETNNAALIVPVLFYYYKCEIAIPPLICINTAHFPAFSERDGGALGEAGDVGIVTVMEFSWYQNTSVRGHERPCAESMLDRPLVSR